jgi:hypothetical protein
LYGGGPYYYWFNPNATQLVPIDCAGRKASSGYHRFDYNGTGSHASVHDVYFAEPDKFTILYTAKDKFGRIRDQRYVQLRPPFVLEVIERDDGMECPKPLRKVEFKVKIDFVAAALCVADNKACGNAIEIGGDLFDLLQFRNNNDRVARWIIPCWDRLEGFSRNWLYGGDADINVGNNGFSRTQIPLEQVPYGGPEQVPAYVDRCVTSPPPGGGGGGGGGDGRRRPLLR